MSIPVPGRLAESVRQAVVQIQSTEESSGSGVAISSNQVITNAHVLRGATIRVQAWDGSVLPASVLKLNRTRDLALIEVTGLKACFLPLGDSRALRPGTPVFATGNPFGFVGAVSSGVIHHIGMRRWICADVRLAPGNSGGPLTNFSGQIVGINTMVVNGGRGNGGGVNGGLALAVPSHEVDKFLKHDDARNLGVVVRGVKFKDRFGVLVTAIVSDSPAEAASLLIGDILVGANDVKFEHPDDLTDSIDNAKDGKLELEFFRGGSVTARHVTASLGARGSRAAA